MLSLSGRQYYCAISLFRELEKSRIASVGSNMPRGWDRSVYYVEYREGIRIKPIGWVVVRNNPSGPRAWNDMMRRRNIVYALWPPGLFRWPSPGGKWPDLSDYDEVQLTTIYPVRAWSEKAAAKEAWQKLILGQTDYMEWYDASPGRKWSKFFKQIHQHDGGLEAQREGSLPS